MALPISNIENIKNTYYAYVNSSGSGDSVTVTSTDSSDATVYVGTATYPMDNAKPYPPVPQPDYIGPYPSVPYVDVPQPQSPDPKIEELLKKLKSFPPFPLDEPTPKRERSIPKKVKRTNPLDGGKRKIKI